MKGLWYDITDGGHVTVHIHGHTTRKSDQASTLKVQQGVLYPFLNGRMQLAGHGPRPSHRLLSWRVRWSMCGA